MESPFNASKTWGECTLPRFHSLWETKMATLFKTAIRKKTEQFSKSIQRNGKIGCSISIIIGHSFYLIWWLLKEPFCCGTCRVQYRALRLTLLLGWAIEMGTCSQQLFCRLLLFSVRVPKAEDLRLQLSVRFLLVSPQLLLWHEPDL